MEKDNFDVKKENEELFNNLDENPYLLKSNDVPDSSSKTLLESSDLSKEDEEFLLKHFDQGMHLAQEFANLLQE